MLKGLFWCVNVEDVLFKYVTLSRMGSGLFGYCDNLLQGALRRASIVEYVITLVIVWFVTRSCKETNCCRNKSFAPVETFFSIKKAKPTLTDIDNIYFEILT